MMKNCGKLDENVENFWIIKKQVIGQYEKLEIRRLEDFQLEDMEEGMQKIMDGMQVEYRQIINLTRNN